MLILRSQQHPEPTLHPPSASTPSTPINQALPSRSKSPNIKAEPILPTRVTKPSPQKPGKLSLKLRPPKPQAPHPHLPSAKPVPRLKLSWRNRDADLARELVQTLDRLDSLSLQVLEKGSSMGDGVLQVYWQVHMETRENIVRFLEGLGRKGRRGKGRDVEG